MQTVCDLAQLDAFIQQQPGVVVLFGGANCSVCHSIKPRLQALLTQTYPALQQLYVDCHVTPELGAQHGVFSLPVVRVYFNGQRFVEKGRSFSLAGLLDEIARPYRLLFDESN
ncbi:MAG: thioredoxin family protein [Thiomicrospira sp.]|jgi:thioredoxin-like negative regulator of GroEL|nr:thioredoxin family protein [Thiomicrospira sp.]